MHWPLLKDFFGLARKAVKLSDSQVSAHTTYTCVHARGPKVFDELMKVGFTTILAWANLDLFGSLMNNFFVVFHEYCICIFFFHFHGKNNLSTKDIISW